MAKRWETFEHTADIGLAASADTLGELFEALAEGLAGLIAPAGQVRPAERREISACSEDVEALAVDFLAEVMNAIQPERFLVASVAVGEITQTSVRAELSGEAYDPARHELCREIKAVTYHELKVAQERDVWIARVILDI